MLKNVVLHGIVHWFHNILMFKAYLGLLMRLAQVRPRKDPLSGPIPTHHEQGPPKLLNYIESLSVTKYINMNMICHDYSSDLIFFQKTKAYDNDKDRRYLNFT